MKHPLIVRLVALAFSSILLLSAKAQTSPRTPGPEHAKLGIFPGKWTWEETTQQSPFGPAGTSKYKGESRMILGGFFLEERGAGKSSDGTHAEWLSITGYDSEKNRYQQSYFNSRGEFDKPWKAQPTTATVEGNTWTFVWSQEAAGKLYQCKNVVLMSPKGRNHTYEMSYSEDGINWKPWTVGKATKTGKVSSK